MYLNKKEFTNAIENVGPSLSLSQKKVAAFLMSNENEFIFKTAKELAAIIGVSESTIVRFARIAGFENYVGMQRFIQRECMRNMDTHSAVEARDGQRNALESAVRRDISYLNKLLRPQFYDNFIRAAQMIIDAGRIYVCGSRGASSLAEHFFYNINYMKPNVYSLAKDAGDWRNLMLECGGDSLMVAICMPRYSKRTCDMIRLAKEMGAQVISVTDSFISPAAELADCVLACEIGLEYFIWSSTVVVSTLDALLIQVARLDQDAVRNRMQKMEGYIAEHADEVFAGA